MEPQQVALWTGVDVVVQCAVRLSILCCGIRTGMSAVETNAVVVGLMVVNRAPLQGNVCIVTIGLGAVVLIKCKDMVQSYWHHIIYTSFATTQHHRL